jgi:hypothetical protein
VLFDRISLTNLPSTPAFLPNPLPIVLVPTSYQLAFCFLLYLIVQGAAVTKHNSTMSGVNRRLSESRLPADFTLNLNQNGFAE